MWYTNRKTWVYADFEARLCRIIPRYVALVDFPGWYFVHCRDMRVGLTSGNKICFLMLQDNIIVPYIGQREQYSSLLASQDYRWLRQIIGVFPSWRTRICISSQLRICLALSYIKTLETLSEYELLFVNGNQFWPRRQEYICNVC